MYGIDRALQVRLFGLGSFDSGDSVLDSILAVHHNVVCHALDRNAKLAPWSLIAEEVEKLNGNAIGVLHHTIVINLRAIVQYHLGNKEEASNLLCVLDSIEGVAHEYPEFWNLLRLENLYYSLKLGVNASVHQLKELRTIPKRSHTLVWYYLENIIALLPYNCEDFLRVFGDRSLSYLLCAIKDPNYDQAALLGHLKRLLTQCRFPSAHETNDFELEEFHSMLQFYFSNSTVALSQEWSKLLHDAMTVTFQSSTIAKAAMYYFIRNGQEDVGLLNFVNFINYSERRRGLNGGEYDDILCLINSYTYVLSRDGIPDEVGQVFNKSKLFIKLKQLVKDFYQGYKMPLITREQSVDWFSNRPKLVVPPRLSKILSSAWHLFYLFEKSSLSHLLKKDLCYYLANEMYIDSKGIDVKFHYAYVLASMRQIAMCTKFLKTCILKSNPEDYRSWHLLALCESIQEDKETSFKIVCSVLKAMAEAFEEDRLSLRDRWQLIHLKLTQLALVKETLGVKDALDMLPEVYQLYAALFPNTGNKDKDEYRLGPKHKQTKEYLFQSVWFFAAKLFLEDRDLANAREAIDESKRVTDVFTNLSINIARGYLALCEDSRVAMVEFQHVLGFDPINVDAVVGFGKIVYPDDTDTVETFFRHKLPSATAPNEKSLLSAFANEDDRSAAVAQLKLMLESCIEKSIEGYYTPEVWWYASKVYDEYNDSERLEHALWQCIKLQKLEPIRDFKTCVF